MPRQLIPGRAGQILRVPLIVPPGAPPGDGTAPFFVQGVSTQDFYWNYANGGLAPGMGIIDPLLEPVAASVVNGQGWDGSPTPSTGLSGFCGKIPWTVTYDGGNDTQADNGFFLDGVDPGVRTAYCSWKYRVTPGFYYGEGFPDLGKKTFLIANGSNRRITFSLGDNMNNVLPLHNWESLHPGQSAAWSLSPTANQPSFYDASNPNKIDSDQEYFPHFGQGIAQTPAGFIGYLTDGRWHEWKFKRTAESVDGALDGAFNVWLDNYRIVNHGGFGIGTGSDTSWSEMEFGSTFNGGSQFVQAEFVDEILVWH